MMILGGRSSVEPVPRRALPRLAEQRRAMPGLVRSVRRFPNPYFFAFAFLFGLAVLAATSASL